MEMPSTPDINATQLNLHRDPSSPATPGSDDNAAFERRLEEGRISLKHNRPGRGIESESAGCPVRGRKLLPLAGWVIAVAAASVLGQKVRFAGFTPAWLPTGLVASALIRTPTPSSVYLSLVLWVIMVGTWCTTSSLPTALYSASITLVCGVLFATVIRRVTPGVVLGAETLRDSILFCILVPISSLLEACCFAVPASTDSEHRERGFNMLVARFLASNLTGSMLVVPFCLCLTERNKRMLLAMGRRRHRHRAVIFVISLASMAAIPFAFVSIRAATYDLAKYYMLPFATAAGLSAGVPGISLSIAIGFSSMATVTLRLRETRDDNAVRYYGARDIDYLLRLQLWTISVMAGGLMFTAARRELQATQLALAKLKRDADRNPAKGWKRSSLALTESSMILSFVCKHLGKPMQEILRQCQPLMSSQRSNPEEEIAARPAQLLGKGIARQLERMLPILSDASQLASMASGDQKEHLAAVDLDQLMQELANELSADLANTRFHTRFNLPKNALVERYKLRRIFRAMIVSACKHKTPRSRITIEASVTTCFSRSADHGTDIDLDITITVSDWVIDNSLVDALVRPYAHPDSSKGSSASLGSGRSSFNDLSLAVASVLARSLGGRLVVYGQYGRGTIFNCKLPTRVDRAFGAGLALSEQGQEKPGEETKGPDRAPLLRQLTVAANSAAELSKSLGKRLRRRSKHSEDSVPGPSSRASAKSLPGSSGELVTSDDEELLMAANVCEIEEPHKYLESLPNRDLVLIVDDSRINRLILARMLQQYPELEVHEAADGVEAFNACMSNSYALIFMDLIMGEMDGYECTQRLRREGIFTPVLLTTANVARTETFKRAGVDALLIKPITKQHLAKALLDFQIIESNHPTLQIVKKSARLTPPSHSSSPTSPVPTKSPSDTAEGTGDYFGCKPIPSGSGTPTTPTSPTGVSHPTPLTRSYSPKPGISGSRPNMAPNSVPMKESRSSGSLGSGGRLSGGRVSPMGTVPRPHVFSHLAPILIVDDNPICRRIMTKQLRKLVPGRDIFQATDGREAVALCSSGQKFAIIFTDLTMTNMDGHIAAARIRSMRSIGGGPPIVAVTGHILDGESFQGLRASGINDAITKPVVPEVLANCLRTYGILSGQAGSSDIPSERREPGAGDGQDATRGMPLTRSTGDLSAADMIDGARSNYKLHIARTRSTSHSDMQSRVKAARRVGEAAWPNAESVSSTGTPASERTGPPRPILLTGLLNALDANI